MLAVKLLGAASAYALAWWVSRYEGPAAYGRFELALTVLTIAALAARLGLDGVLVKWMAASKVKGEEEVQRRLVGRVMRVTGLLAAPLLAALMWGGLPIAHILVRGRDAGPNVALGCRRRAHPHCVGRVL